MKSIGKILNYIIVTLLVTFFVGCSSKTAESNSPKIYVSKQLRINKINFNLNEYHKSEIVYHTRNELETLFRDDLYKKLKEKELITEDSNVDLLDINIDYVRRYVGDETPLKSDSLGYPNYNYSVIVKNNIGKELLRKDRNNLMFKGGFAMNIQVVTATLRDKKYEIQFIEALSNSIVNEIENINK
ncbi:hypothetical protein [Aliarcobacter lanthieri]|uniref:hypothetical protein n=1 Tax=Aliarcobacter lanthieri TaxID=1355374 RepID=UPI000478D141|nr:hypothetical protein [Aliarcobacter lanthieri]